MPLITDQSKVQDWQLLNEQEPDSTKSRWLGHLLMAVGVPEITDATWNDTWVRIEILQKVNGGFLADEDGSRIFYTPEDIHRRIGYYTNASAFPWTQFIKNLRNDLRFRAGKAILKNQKVSA